MKMLCTKCGKELPNNAHSCVHCGNLISKVINENEQNKQTDDLVRIHDYDVQNYRIRVQNRNQ